MIYITVLLLSLFITISLVPLCARLANRLHVYDMPDARKVHTHPIPRTGGLAMALGALVPFAFFATLTPFVKAYMAGVTLLTIVGVLDDVKNLGYRPKFVAQIAAACLAVFYGGVKISSLGLLLPNDALLPEWIAIPLTLLAIVGVTNAINLADGLDGLAGGICLLSFSCIGYLAYQGENTTVALLSVVMVGAVFGFLRFNTHPASIFMGDTGSQLLGFSAVTFSLIITQGNTPLSPVLPLLLLGFPILDTLAVMFERVHNGRSPFVADKNHFHHKLIRRGFSHSESVLIIYVIQAALVTSAFLLRFHSEWLLLISYVAFSVMVLSAFTLADHLGWQMKRYQLVDSVIKVRLRALVAQDLHIRVLGRSIEIAIPVLFFTTCMAMHSVSVQVMVLASALLAFLLFTILIKKNFMTSGLRNLYLLVPFIIYYSEKDPAAWMTELSHLIYNFSFVAVALLVILTLKFTRRKQGFRFNLMDFLILFIALVVPNLPEPQIQSYNLGLLTTKIIVFLFSFEVLIGELRGSHGRVVYPAILSLVVLIVKGIIE